MGRKVKDCERAWQDWKERRCCYGRQKEVAAFTQHSVVADQVEVTKDKDGRSQIV
jgi:hypothetical protein